MQRTISRNGKGFRICLPKDWMDEINARNGHVARFAKFEWLGDGTFKIIPLGVGEVCQ